MFCRLSVFSLREAIPFITQKSFLFNNLHIVGFSKTKSQKMWMNEHVNDEYVKKAQKDNYRSRATYKLIEIQEKHKIFKQGYRVLELGSAPGGWTQVAVEFTKSSEKNPIVLAIDRDHMDSVTGAFFYKGDINDQKTQILIPEFFKLEPVDVILSDMAPNFSGDLDTDHLQIMDLNNMCIDMCTKNLKIGGSVVMKTLNGTMEKDAFKMYKTYFKEFLRVKPKASRSRSSEVYYLGKGYGQSKEYETFKNIEEKREKGLQVDEEDMPDLGFTDQELLEKTRQVIQQMYEQGKARKKQQELKKKNKENQDQANVNQSKEMKENNITQQQQNNILQSTTNLNSNQELKSDESNSTNKQEQNDSNNNENK